MTSTSGVILSQLRGSNPDCNCFNPPALLLPMVLIEAILTIFHSHPLFLSFFHPSFTLPFLYFPFTTPTSITIPSHFYLRLSTSTPSEYNFFSLLLSSPSLSLSILFPSFHYSVLNLIYPQKNIFLIFHPSSSLHLSHHSFFTISNHCYFSFSHTLVSFNTLLQLISIFFNITT